VISWHAIAIAALTVGGIGCFGIGAICLLASDQVDDVELADRTISSGIAAGFIGLLLIAAAFGVRSL
jgi:hypothetical protein